MALGQRIHNDTFENHSHHSAGGVHDCPSGLMHLRSIESFT